MSIARPAHFSGIALTILLLNAGCTERTVPGHRSGVQTVGRYGVFHPATETRPSIPDTLCSEERARRDTALRMDRERLLENPRIVVDSTTALIVPPAHLQAAGTAYTTAQTAPVIEFGMIPAEPRFFRELNGRDESGCWGNYAQSIQSPGNGRYYAAVGDHGQFGACIYIVEYDPSTRSLRCLPEINRTLGRGENQFGDGIIHGWLDLYQSPDIPKPHLWFCTYWSRFPEPVESDYATGYDGGHILSCDPETGDIVDYGAPLPRASWPYHRVDTRRGMLYAVEMKGEFLAWDIAAQRTRWAGFPPAGLAWYNRAILLDEETGRVYTTNDSPADPERAMICYDPATNRFSRLPCSMPRDRHSKKIEPMRTQTRNRGPDGLFRGITVTGELFSFDPEREIIAGQGPCWIGDQRYTCSLVQSPGGRYLYYAPQTYRDGSPVVQYDIRTGRRKVLAFLAPHYSSRYGYLPTVSYSLTLDAAGGRLFMVWNGAFTDVREDVGVGRFGNCSIMLLHIPDSERTDDRI